MGLIRIEDYYPSIHREEMQKVPGMIGKYGAKTHSPGNENLLNGE